MNKQTDIKYLYRFLEGVLQDKRFSNLSIEHTDFSSEEQEIKFQLPEYFVQNLQSFAFKNGISNRTIFTASLLLFLMLEEDQQKRLTSLTEETNNLLLSKISNISEYFKLATLLDEINQEIRTAIKG
ncbi:hypothetical protein I8254_00065 [Providencia rettgeri]|uniref:hypothetical protein n=1 Tax=Providencia TaxID=586 RepID=UPI000C7EBE52|nr:MULTISPECIES: hypothetical protein [Providencia]AXH61467.1 hypothetical protein CYG50_05180 [Providencia huaxiensis]AXH61478.1 hypothetical protein CYG50_05240 [Providencia huaxiensis]MBJ9969417.1 hypothetical protein [Providencia rettgeri]MCB6144541.1 hypothetical protein [Providencia rettgeri]MCF8961465.1 hypothetical protein [Providencia rettgeri]